MACAEGTYEARPGPGAPDVTGVTRVSLLDVFSCRGVRLTHSGSTARHHGATAHEGNRYPPRSRHFLRGSALPGDGVYPSNSGQPPRLCSGADAKPEFRLNVR